MATAALPAQNLSRHGIGASEISAVCGLNPYASPWDVYLRKIGEAPDVEPNAPMEWGHRLEPAIRQKYVDDTGLTVFVPPTSLFHPVRTWARATPDGVVIDEAKQWSRLLQCKNVGYWVGKDWEQGPPPYVVLQEQWELWVTGLDRADVAALIGGNDFRVFTVHRDDKMIADLVDIASAFWRNVETRMPPKVDESEACRKHLSGRLPRASTVELQADEQIDALFSDWHEIVLRQKHDEKRLEQVRNEIRRIMAESGAGAIRSSFGVAKLSVPKDAVTRLDTDWSHVAQLLSVKCAPGEFDELVRAATTATNPAPKAPTLYAPKEWAKESK